MEGGGYTWGLEKGYLMIKLPKKGDLGNGNNYRGITLLSIPGKVFNRIKLNKLKDIVDPKLRDNQAGFCKTGPVLIKSLP